MDEDGFGRLGAARVTIAGLGLMGGSLALGLRGKCGELMGVDPDPAAAALAVERNVVDRVADFATAASATDLLILAAPVRAILALLRQLGHEPRPERPTVVLDLGSTKAEIVQAMRALPAGWDPVGGHPMCGKEASGLAHAEAGLFQGRVFVLTRLERTSPGALRLAGEVVAAVGAREMRLGAEQHDTLAASSSHLPYLAASALVRAAEAAGDGAVWDMAASGFRDTSRLAASDVTMMLDILLTNRAAIGAALARYRAELDDLTRLLAAGDAEGLRALLQGAQARRNDPMWAEKS
jgi:prephenate dehydrogenase